MRVSVILTGAIVTIMTHRFMGGELLEPVVVVLDEAGFVVVDVHARRDVHGVHQDQSLRDTGFVDGFLHFVGDIDVFPSAAGLKPELFSVGFHRQIPLSLAGRCPLCCEGLILYHNLNEMSPFAAILALAGFVNLFIWAFLAGQPSRDPVKFAFLLFLSVVTLCFGAEFMLVFPFSFLESSGSAGPMLVRFSTLLWILSGFAFLNFIFVLSKKKRSRHPLFICLGMLSAMAAGLSFMGDFVSQGVALGPWGATASPSGIHLGVYFVPLFAFYSGVAILGGEMRSTRAKQKRQILQTTLIGGFAVASLCLTFRVLLPHFWGWKSGFQLVDSSLTVFFLLGYAAIARPHIRAVGLERWARHLLRDFPSGIVLLDTSYRVRFINQQAQSYLGQQGPVRPGIPFDTFAPGIVPAAPKSSVELAVGEHGNRLILLADFVLQQSEGIDIYWIVVLNDITDRKKQEDRLKRRQSELDREIKSYEEALNQAKKIEALSALSSGIAHDFNNLLSVILGFAGAARDELADNTLVAKDIDEIVLASRRAQNIVDQILTLNEAKNREPRVVAVKDIIEDVLSVVKSHLPSEFQVLEDEKTPHLAVKVDPSQLKQALLNLVLNAYQAMESRPGTIRIGLDRSHVEEEFAREHPPLSSGSYVTIQVCDSGRGIAREALSRIFDPFYTTQDTASGTGLGLPTALHICKEHGGTLTVKSQAGQGTTVQVYLPSFDLPLTSIAPLAAVEKVGDERILIVDDEEQFVRLGRRILEPLGYDVTVHTDSVSAWNAFWSNPDSFDLVITDHSMPQINGSELANEIACIRPELPIILVSGDTQAQVVADEEDIVFTEFLSKPIPSDVLGDTVRRLLDGAD